MFNGKSFNEKFLFTRKYYDFAHAINCTHKLTCVCACTYVSKMQASQGTVCSTCLLTKEKWTHQDFFLMVHYEESPKKSQYDMSTPSPIFPVRLDGTISYHVISKVSNQRYTSITTSLQHLHNYSWGSSSFAIFHLDNSFCHHFDSYEYGRANNGVSS